MTVTTDRRPTGRLLARAAAAVLATGVAVLGLAGPASAHVRVDPDEATQGSYAALTFRVPNESSTAATTKLEIALPADAPFASVSVKPISGWKATTTSAKLSKPIDAHGTQVTEAVNRVTFTATSKATGIQPGEFQEFELSVGPLPEDKDKIFFKSLQTYSDGQISRWIEEQTGSEEPENPAPELTLVKGTADGDGHGDAEPSEAAATSSTSDDSGNGLAIGLGVAGLVAGVAGLIAGLMALRRSTASSASES
ncbi:YcnI family protein [Cryptosporangium sp. NPDC048952]|uniref:YcnI family copper-binding membrane protein n=1 Tax=Cryptosporangium sp. NPDC048952 TaxID=3363961 RepID=UPI0037180ED2